MRVLAIAALVAFSVSAGAAPIVYVASQTVVSLRLQGQPRSLVVAGDDRKIDASFESRARWYGGESMLKIEKSYMATTPEGEVFVPFILQVTQGGQQRVWHNPEIPNVTYGWRQFRLGQQFVDMPDDLVKTTYMGWLSFDNRGEQVPYVMVLWLSSDRGEASRFVVNVPAGQKINYAPIVGDDKPALWTLTSCEPLLGH